MRHTTAILLTAACLALAGCSSSSDDSKPQANATATVTVVATPSLSRTETKRLCSVAVAEAAPGWEDWNFDPGNWQDDPRTPEVCKGLVDKDWAPRGNREFQDALLDGLEMADDPRAQQ